MANVARSRTTLAVAVLAVVAAAVVAFLLLRHHGSVQTRTTRSAAVVRVDRSLCHDLLLLQTGFRAPALGRLLPKLRHDAALYGKAGDPSDQRAVGDLVAAVTKLRSALTSGGNTTEATKGVEKALQSVPGC